MIYLVLLVAILAGVIAVYFFLDLMGAALARTGSVRWDRLVLWTIAIAVSGTLAVWLFPIALPVVLR